MTHPTPPPPSPFDNPGDAMVRLHEFAIALHQRIEKLEAAPAEAAIGEGKPPEASTPGIPASAITAGSIALSEYDLDNGTFGAATLRVIDAAMPALEDHIREFIAQQIKSAAYTIPPGTSPKGIISGRDQAASIARGAKP